MVEAIERSSEFLDYQASQVGDLFAPLCTRTDDVREKDVTTIGIEPAQQPCGDYRPPDLCRTIKESLRSYVGGSATTTQDD